MTAINALVMPDAAYLLTDTAIYHDDGLVVGFSTKTHTLPHLKMAFATSGSHEQGPRVLNAFQHFASFDDLTERGAAHLRDLWESGEFECIGDDHDNFRLVMAGWSDRSNRAELWATSTEKEPEIEPLTFAMGAVAINPSVHDDVLHEAGLLVEGKPVGDAGPEQWLLQLIDIQRSRRSGARGTPSQYEEPEDGQHVIGGHAVMTKIGKHGITQRVVRCWRDSLREYIDPGELVK